MNDTELSLKYIIAYNNWQNLGGAHVTLPGKAQVNDVAYGTMSVADFLGNLAKFIFNPVRMGELVVGVVLVGVGMKAVLGGRSVPQPARTVIRVTTAPARASREAVRFAEGTQRAASRDYARSYARAAGSKAGRNA